MRDALGAQKGKNGAGIRILTETVTSPSLAAQLRAFRKYIQPPSGINGNPPVRTVLAPQPARRFGQPTNTYYNLANANVVVSLDSDFLAAGAGSLRYARQFASRRRVNDEQAP